MWDRESGMSIDAITDYGHSGAINDFSVVGDLVFSASNDKTVKVGAQNQFHLSHHACASDLEVCRARCAAAQCLEDTHVTPATPRAPATLRDGTGSAPCAGPADRHDDHAA